MDSQLDMGGCSSKKHQEAATPRLCGGGCGFFGTAENQGFCSKCYNARLKEAIAKTQAAILVPPPSPSDDNVPKEREANDSCASRKGSRCSVCTRKVGLVWHACRCRCGLAFCTSHRHPEAHGCTFDFKKAAKLTIHQENPICKADKMTRRI